MDKYADALGVVFALFALVTILSVLLALIPPRRKRTPNMVAWARNTVGRDEET